MTAYADFIASKRRAVSPVGFEAEAITPALFAHQVAIVRWALRLGRCAIFADTGLGKTAMQLEWARQVAARAGGRVLVLAPLAVREQTIAEALRFGIDAGEVGSSSPIHVINYHRLHQLDPSDYVGVVLDESSILKSFDGRTRTQLIEAFSRTEYRLACTDADGAIAQNLRRKALAADEMAAEMLALVADTQLQSVMGERPGTVDIPHRTIEVPAWLS